MISDKYKISSGMKDIIPALDIIEKTCAYSGLDKEASLQLRLMGEEMLGMMQGILFDYEGHFWVESDGDTMKLHVEARSEISESERNKLLTMASSGQNTKPKGLLNKLRALVEGAFYCDPDTPPLYFADECSFQRGGSFGNYGYVWAMYGNSDMSSSKRDSDYDELEMSILGKLADNIEVSAYPPRLSLIVSKKMTAQK